MIKRMLVPMMAGIALLTVGGTALAADVTGTVKEIHLYHLLDHKVVLDNGKTYIFKHEKDLSHVKPGEKVKIVYETKGKKNEATEISAAE